MAADVALSGRVVNAQGAPVSGVRVSVSVLDVPVTSINTQPNGSYEFPPLLPGIYVLSAGKETFASDRRVVSLSARTSLQDFLLRPMPALPSMEIANSTPPFILPVSADMGNRDEGAGAIWRAVERDERFIGRHAVLSAQAVNVQSLAASTAA